MFSERLKMLRQERGFSLDDLAKEVGSTKSYIWELEKRPDIKVSAELVIKLSQALGVTVEHLMGIAPSEEDMVFFREYKSLTAPTKVQIQSILKALKKST